MLSRSPHTPASLIRRSGAQRRMRRAAAQRLFCSTNGCTTFLVPDESGRRAVCPICGLQRSVAAPAPQHADAAAAAPTARLPH